MALSGRASIQSEDITSTGSHRAVRDALIHWNRRVGPVPYNDWQSVFFALIREHGLIDYGASDNEPSADRQVRILDMYEEIQTALHGAEF